MRLVITGTPGTGKTQVAKRLAKRFRLVYVNEKQFAEKKKIGKIDRRTGERVVPLGRLQKELNRFLKRHPNAVVEGHLSCECRLRPVDWTIVLRVSPDRLEFRLQERHYSEVKIQDNVLCEGIDYCLKHAKRNYVQAKILEIANNKELKDTLVNIIAKISPKPKKRKAAT